LDEKRLSLGVTDDVAAFEIFTPAMLVTLGEKGVKTLDDLADLASDELIEILGTAALDEEAANEIIMQARAHWFENEEGGEGVADGDADDVTPGENPESGEAVAHDRN
jgi:N utilization substance protein A